MAGPAKTAAGRRKGDKAIDSEPVDFKAGPQFGGYWIDIAAMLLLTVVGAVVWIWMKPGTSQLAACSNMASISDTEALMRRLGRLWNQITPLHPSLRAPEIKLPYTYTPSNPVIFGYILFHAVQQMRVRLESQGLPQGTKALLAANLAAFFLPGGIPAAAVSLCPAKVLELGQYYRLVTANFVHTDPEHLLANMTVLLPYGSSLEQRLGTRRYLDTVLTAALATQALYVLVAWADKAVLGRSRSYYNGAVGFSGVGLALQVIYGHRESNSFMRFFFFLVPSRFAVWPNLFITQLLMPDISLLGHLCGVAAGLAHVYVPHAVRRLRDHRRSSAGGANLAAAEARPRFYGGGTTSGRPLARRGPPWWSPSFWRVRRVPDWLVHAGCAAGTLLLVQLVSQQRHRRQSPVIWVAD